MEFETSGHEANRSQESTGTDVGFEQVVQGRHEAAFQKVAVEGQTPARAGKQRYGLYVFGQASVAHTVVATATAQPM
ncbi:hypothetical protein [Streptomyces sp. NPDC001601]|uniref:hypothetical protein n=1 Tax=unclassified Streptomyces TaxID=2593676 RepID=UPI0036801264